MASEQGPVATDAPLANSSGSRQIDIKPPSISAEAFSSAEFADSHSLKRPRASSPSSPSAADQASGALSPTKFAKLSEYTRSYAPALTGQAAIEDEQRRQEEETRLHPPNAISDNPAQKALYALRGAQAAMSRLNEAPPAVSATADDANHAEENAGVAEAAAPPEEQRLHTPQPAPGMHGLAGEPHVVHSPAAMDVDARDGRPNYALQQDAQMEDKAQSMSYPGILSHDVSMPAPSAPNRGMSLPMAQSHDSEMGLRSPSSKKHKCPYCDTEFTRHHNLKSHLLTHSQEKPFSCTECNSRFRRLHDLKRHSKLHTGEKPHVCPKCLRKFARGDALARHSKGHGGCAGRRTSTSSFAGEDEYDGGSATEMDDTIMSGVTYDANETGMSEEDRRRFSLPSIKAQHVTGGHPEGYAPHSRTYPPAGVRAGTVGGLFPPTVDRPAVSSNTSPSMANSVSNAQTPSTSISSIPVSGASASLYSPGMTESPKPLSPGAHGAQYTRRPSDLASSHTVPGVATSAMAAPPAAGHSRTSSGPSHGHNSVSGDSGNNMFSSDTGLWAYIQSLEERLRHQDERLQSHAERIASLEIDKAEREAQVASLTNEITSLRSQLAMTTAALATQESQHQEIQHELAPSLQETAAAAQPTQS